jgi:hypothetical protein
MAAARNVLEVANEFGAEDRHFPEVRKFMRPYRAETGCAGRS